MARSVRAGDESNPWFSLLQAVLGAHKKTSGRRSWKFDVVCSSQVSFVSTQALY